MREKILRAVVRYHLCEGVPPTSVQVHPDDLTDFGNVNVTVFTNVKVPRGCVWV